LKINYAFQDIIVSNLLYSEKSVLATLPTFRG